MNFKVCPGAANIKGTPELKEKTCPNCGQVIELFTGERQALCRCGFIAYNDTVSCISWCKFARECVGDEAYDRLTGDVI